MNRDSHLIMEAYLTVREQATTPPTTTVQTPAAAPQSTNLQAETLLQKITELARIPYKNSMKLVQILNSMRNQPAQPGASTTPVRVTNNVELDKAIDDIMKVLGINYGNKEAVYSAIRSLVDTYVTTP